MQPKKILRLPEVINKTGLSRSTIYALIAKGTFPKQIKLSERTSGFFETEVDEYLDKQAAFRNK
jgi:prophage regulatory protein